MQKFMSDNKVQTKLIIMVFILVFLSFFLAFFAQNVFWNGNTNIDEMKDSKDFSNFLISFDAKNLDVGEKKNIGLKTLTSYSFDSPLSRLVIEKPKQGRIEYIDDINLSHTSIEGNVIIDDNFISVNSKQAEELNKPAILTFYNVRYSNPVIYRNGVLYTSYDYTLEDGILTLKVGGFSNYSLGASSNLSTWGAHDNTPIYINNSVEIYANYTNITDSSFISGANCNLFIDGSNYAMIENTSGGYYEYSFNGTTTQKTYNYSVTCNATSFDTLMTSDSFPVLGVVTSFVNRTFSNSTISPSDEINVSIDVRVLEENTTYYMVEEIVPVGWTITVHNGANTTNTQKLRWYYINESGANNITYWYMVQAPANTGEYEFSGSYLFQGMNDNASTQGDTNVSVVVPSANLSVWDTDTYLPIYFNNTVFFYANYTNYTSGDFISGANCNLSIEGSQYTMIEETNGSINGTYYVYNLSTFDTPQTYNYNITCVASSFDTLTGSGSFNVSELTSNVTRSFSSTDVAGNELLNVTIDVNIVNDVPFYIVEDTIPAGFTVVISNGANTTNPQILKWAVFNSSGTVSSASYWYTVQAPASTGEYEFSGVYGIFGMNENESILGPTNVSVTYDAPPVASLNSPANENVTIQTTITFNCSATDDNNLTSIGLYGNWSGSWNLNETIVASGTSDTVTFTKTLPVGSYVWNCLATDSNTQTSFATSNRTLTIAYVDNVAPTWSSNVSSHPATYSNSTQTSLGVTWNDNIGVTASYIETNYSGVSTNYTGSTFSRIFPAGTFYWKSYASDITGNLNSTNTWVFTIAKVTPSLSLQLNGASNNLTIERGNSITISSSSPDVSVLLYENGSSISNGARTYNNVGVYNITATAQSNQNYTSNSKTYFVTVQDTITPSIISGPSVNPSNVSVSFSWTTDEASNYTIVLNDSSTVSNSSFGTIHEDVITGLTPSTNYSYIVTICDAYSNCDSNETGTFLTSAVFVNTAPQISNITPIDNTLYNTSLNVTFNYNIVDSEQSSVTCNLIIDGVIVDTRVVDNNSIVSYSTEFTDETIHLYNVSCYDGFTTTVSSTRTFNVSLVVPVVSINYSLWSNTTTNFSAYTTKNQFKNLTNVLFENGYGKINYTSNVSIIYSFDVASALSIAQNTISVNPSIAPALNTTAILSFKGITFSKPQVLKNNVLLYNYGNANVSFNATSHILSFNVTGFSTYTIRETPTTTTTTTITSGGGSSNNGGGGGYIEPTLEVTTTVEQAWYDVEVNEDLEWEIKDYTISKVDTKSKKSADKIEMKLEVLKTLKNIENDYDNVIEYINISTVDLIPEGDATIEFRVEKKVADKNQIIVSYYNKGSHSWTDSDDLMFLKNEGNYTYYRTTVDSLDSILAIRTPNNVEGEAVTTVDDGSSEVEEVSIPQPVEETPATPQDPEEPSNSNTMVWVYSALGIIIIGAGAGGIAYYIKHLHGTAGVKHGQITASNEVHIENLKHDLEMDNIEKYVETYKEQYPIEQLRETLISSGYNSLKVDEVINRYR